MKDSQDAAQDVAARAPEGVFELFAAQAAAQPDALAVVDEFTTLTFAELAELASAVRMGLPRGARRVGIVMDHGAAMIAAILGVLAAGAAYVPVEPGFPDGHIRFVFEDSGVDCVVASERHSIRFDAADGDARPAFAVLTSEQLLASSAPRVEAASSRLPASPSPASRAAGPAAPAAAPISPAPVRPDELAYILYTSGTTGRPKGIAVEQRNVCHYARAFDREFRVRPGDTMLQYSVCTFDIFVEEVFATLLNGGSLAIPSHETRGDLTRLMGFVERCGVTMISGFPYFLMELNELDRIPSCVRLLISGGDVLRASYVSNLVGREGAGGCEGAGDSANREATGDREGITGSEAAEAVEVYNSYGPSETTVCATYFRCLPGTELPDGTYPIGHAVAGAQVSIRDEGLQPVPAGTVGEICIEGDGVSLGYIGHAASASASSFVALPGGTRLYRSGDLGYELPSGEIAFLRRKDRQVMVWGQRVEPDGVESVLCSCEGIKAGAVRAYPDERGHASYLVAYYVADDEAREGDIREQMGRTLPAYMVPERFVRLERMPLTSNGKVDFAALPKTGRR